MNIIQHASLDEMDFGEFEGKPYAEVVDELEPIDKAWRNGEGRLQLPGGESPAEVFERANEVFQSLLSEAEGSQDRKSTRLNSSHVAISYAVFCLNENP